MLFPPAVRPASCRKRRADKNRPRNEADMCFRINRCASWVPIADLGWNAFGDRGGRLTLQAKAITETTKPEEGELLADSIGRRQENEHSVCGPPHRWCLPLWQVWPRFQGRKDRRSTLFANSGRHMLAAVIEDCKL